MTFNVLALLEQEGYIRPGPDNVLHAEKAFFAARVMRWIRHKVQTDPDFDLPPYLTMLMYYKMGMAELKFGDDDENLYYKLTRAEDEVMALVNSLNKMGDGTVDRPVENTTATSGSQGDPHS